MSSCLLGGSLRSSTCAGMRISPPSTRTWRARLVAMLRAAGAPDVLKMLFTSIVVTEQTTSIGRDKFDLQILNARLREINDAYNPLVIQAVVDGHKYDQQHQHHVDERRDIDFGLQTGAGVVAV